MTIRQQGGVFGRNPTFNNVTVDGILTVDQIVEKTGAAGITLDGVTLKDGNVVLADGKGIDFSATAGTGTSELFDDYEEGTFTPTYVPASGAFDAITYNTQEGYYTKIGNMINVRLFLRIASLTKGAASGGVNIAGLPYAAANSRATAAVYSELFLVNHPSICQASGSNLLLYYRALSNGTSGTRVQVTDLDTGSTENRVLVSICYQTA